MPEKLKMTASMLCNQWKPVYCVIQSHPFITDQFLPYHLHHVLEIKQIESVTHGQYCTILNYPTHFILQFS